MIKLTKLADYGIVLLIHLARDRGTVHAARDLAERSRLPLPTVSRILKLLASAGVLESHRGVKGGYSLVRDPEDVSVAEVIQALEGPIAMTACTEADERDCEHEMRCPAQPHWQVINGAVTRSLQSISLADMARPHPVPQLVRLEAGPGPSPVFAPTGPGTGRETR